MDFSTSVAFIDVTYPATTQFAEYPKLEAKVPHDFFYPFVSSDATFLACDTMMVFVLFHTFIFVFI